MHSHTQSHTHAHKHCLLLGFWQIYFAETKKPKPKPKRTFACGLRPAICKRSLATFDSTRLDSGVVGVVSGSLLSRVCVLAFVSCSLMCSPTVSLSVSPAVYPSPPSPLLCWHLNPPCCCLLPANAKAKFGLFINSLICCCCCCYCCCCCFLDVVLHVFCMLYVCERVCVLHICCNHI